MQFVLFSCQKDKAMEGQGIQLPLECNASEEFSIHYLHLFAIGIIASPVMKRLHRRTSMTTRFTPFSRWVGTG